MMKNKICLVFLLINMINVTVSFAFVTVGDASDTDCDYSDLQNALDSGDSDVRLSNQNSFISNYNLNNQNLNLQGGFANCDDASQNIYVEGTKSEIKSNGNGHVIFINGGGIASEISLANIIINGETSTHENQGVTNGSGLRLEAINGLVTIINSLLHHNTATQGGGLYVNGSEIEVVIINSSISDNISNSKGGGIYCEGATIKMDSTSLIANNQVFGTQSTGVGGGMYAYLCNIEIYAGHSDGVSAGFIGNQSIRDGAGIFAVTSELIINGQQESVENPLLGDNTQPVLFKDNLSDSDNNGTGYGAALYLYLGTTTIKGAWFDGNMGSIDGEGGYNRGSVIYAKNGAVVTMGRDGSQPCWRQGFCNLVSNNNHVAIQITKAPTSVTITDTEFTNNVANWTGLLSIINSSSSDIGDGPFLTFNNNLVHNNTSDNVGLLKAESHAPDHCCIVELNLFNNTISNNQFGGEVFIIRDDVTLNLHGNIVYEPSLNEATFDITNSAFNDINISCLIASEINSIPEVTITTILQDPLFVDVANNDYHLTLDSPAIDFCDNSQYTPPTMDMDQQQRGRDEPDTIDFDGLIDLGVDEYYPPDLIFKNSFDD